MKTTSPTTPRSKAPPAGSVKLPADFTGGDNLPQETKRGRNGKWPVAMLLSLDHDACRFMVGGPWRDAPHRRSRAENGSDEIAAVLPSA